MPKIVFKIEGGEDGSIFAVEAKAAPGESLFELAREAGVPIDAPCAGNGTCGKCRVRLVEGDLSQRQAQGLQAGGHSRFLSDAEFADGWRLACESAVSGDAVVSVPAAAASYIGSIALEVADGESMAEIEEDRGTVSGLAVDVGTTGVSVLLVDMDTGFVLAKASAGNGQIRYGADVINRIIEQQKPGGILRLQKAIINDTLIPLIDSLCNATGVSCESIIRMVVASNTTMNHLLLGVDANSIRIEPYEPAFLEFEPYNPAGIGFHFAQDAQLILAPNIGSYVGGDITAGVLAARTRQGVSEPLPSHIWNRAEMSLLIDLGTNGEIVFGNEDFLMACACSAGPAFEGGDISCGMRAAAGAIESCSIAGLSMEPVFSVIGGGKPVGLCGSGLIDVVAELFRAGIINGKGKFSRDGERIRRDEYGSGCFVLVFAADSGSGRDIVITETDIDNYIRAKAAIFSGIMSLLSPLGFSVADIDDVLIAGGIGSGINIKNAISIGMLPKLSEDRFCYIGNSSLDGAYEILVSPDAGKRVHEIAANMTYIDLSTEAGYMDEFVAACFLPHTDGALF